MPEIISEEEALRRLGVVAAIRAKRFGVYSHRLTPKPGTIPDAITAPPAEWLKDQEYIIRGNREVPCSRCGTICTIAPSTQRVLEEVGEIPIVCVPCMVKQAEEKVERELGPEHR